MSENRLEPVDANLANDEQKSVIAQLGEGRGRIPTPFNIWLHNPQLARGMEIIGTHIDRSPVISEAETEVAILATAVFWNAQYVIANHRRHALKAGVPEDVVDAILAKQRPAQQSGRFGAVCDAVTDMLAGAQVGDDTFELYAELLGRATIAELLITVGYFTSVSLAMNLHALKPKNKD